MPHPAGGPIAVQPYQQPPPRSGLSRGAVVAIVLGSVLGLSLLGTFAYGVVRGFKRAAAKHQAAIEAPGSRGLPQSYTTKNKLLTVHYPADFAVNTVDDSTLVVSRNVGGSVDEGIIVGGVANPVSNEVDEFARVLLTKMDKNYRETPGSGYAETGRHPAQCLGRYEGLQVDVAFKMSSGTRYTQSSCLFMHGNAGYLVRYYVPVTAEARDKDGLVGMLSATDVVELDLVTATEAPGAGGLTESYKMQNGRLTAHYPADFAAQSMDDATLLVTHTFATGDYEGIALVGVPHPISKDTREFARVVLGAMDTKKKSLTTTFSETDRRPAQCMGRYPGLEVDTTYTLKTGTQYVERSCVFVRGDVGYVTRVYVPTRLEARDGALLDKMVLATEMAKGS
jgi:hypothetical protein